MNIIKTLALICASSTLLLLGGCFPKGPSNLNEAFDVLETRSDNALMVYSNGQGTYTVQTKNGTYATDYQALKQQSNANTSARKALQMLINKANSRPFCFVAFYKTTTNRIDYFGLIFESASDAQKTQVASYIISPSLMTQSSIMGSVGGNIFVRDVIDKYLSSYNIQKKNTQGNDVGDQILTACTDNKQIVIK